VNLCVARNYQTPSHTSRAGSSGYFSPALNYDHFCFLHGHVLSSEFPHVNPSGGPPSTEGWLRKCVHRGHADLCVEPSSDYDAFPSAFIEALRTVMGRPSTEARYAEGVSIASAVFHAQLVRPFSLLPCKEQVPSLYHLTVDFWII